MILRFFFLSSYTSQQEIMSSAAAKGLSGRRLLDDGGDRSTGSRCRRAIASRETRGRGLLLCPSPSSAVLDLREAVVVPGDRGTLRGHLSISHRGGKPSREGSRPASRSRSCNSRLDARGPRSSAGLKGAERQLNESRRRFSGETSLREDWKLTFATARGRGDHDPAHLHHALFFGPPHGLDLLLQSPKIDPRALGR